MREALRFAGKTAKRHHRLGGWNVRGMIADDKLARSVGDIGFFEFRRQLEYKATLVGGVVVVVDRRFPSSKNVWRVRLLPRIVAAVRSRLDLCRVRRWRPGVARSVEPVDEPAPAEVARLR